MEKSRPSPSDERRSRRSVLRKAGIVGLVLAAVVAVGWLTVGVLLHTMTDPERLARWTEERLEASIGRDVEVGAVRLGVFPRLEVDLRGLRVDNPPDFDAPPLAEVERIRLGVALLPLLRRRVEVDEAGVSGAAVRLRVLEDGRTNFGDFLPADRGDGGGGSTPFRAEVGRVGAEGVTVSYRDDATGLTTEAAGVEGEASLGDASGGERPLELGLRAESLSASGLAGGRSLAPRQGGLAITGRVGADGRWLAIREGELRLEPVRVGVQGRVDSLRSPVRRLDLRLGAGSLRLEEVAELAEGLTPTGAGAGGGRTGGATALDSLRPAGILGLDVEVRGPVGGGRRPEVAGTVRLREGRYGAPGRPPLAEGLEGEMRVGADSVRVERLRGRLLDGPLEVSGAAAVDSAMGYRLAVTAAPRVESWPPVVPGTEPAAELSGSVELDLTVRGRPGAPAGTRVGGTVRPAGIRLRRDRWAGTLELPGGSIRLTGDGLTAVDLPVVAAGDTLRADLEVTALFSSRGRAGGVPSLTGEVRGPRLALDGLLGREAADSVTYGRLAFARLGGGRVAARPPEELAALEGFRRPDSLPVDGTVRAVLGRVTWGPYRMDDVDVEIRLSPDRLEVTRARLATFGGEATGTFSLELGPGPLAPFTLRLAVEGAETAELLSTLTPLGRLATGTSTFTLSSSGRLDTLLLPVADGLSGEGRMDATDGQVLENPVTAALARTLAQPALRAPGFRAWALPFEIRGDQLRLPPGQLTGGPLPVDFAGRVGFGGALELAATVRLPRQAASSLAGRVGGLPAALLNRVASGEGAVPVGLALRGTVTEPTVRLETDALRQALEAAARQEVGGELERRAGGLLRRILGGRDTARADTAGADTAGAAGDTTGAAGDSTGGSPLPD